MLQTYSAPQQSVPYDDRGQSLDLSYFIGIAKRRFSYFVIPFLVVVMLGTGIVEIQRPIYRAVGKILVESPEIPADLVHPTITEVANERVQVIEQRIMARDNLMAVVNKYKLFTREREYMSATDLLDLVRSRMEIKPVALDAQSFSQHPTIAFTLSFDYEVPALAASVANEFLTSILSADASTRTNNAAETTKFLDREVKRIESEHDAVVAQIEAIKQRPPDTKQQDSQTAQSQIKTLATLEATLAEKSSIYSDEHPVIKNLKKNIAALKRVIATSSKTAPDDPPPSDNNILALERHEIDLEKSLEEANRKLNTARLGESMERGQQGERLRVIEQPLVPGKPARPQKMKWLAVSFALAVMTGAGTVTASEMLDGSIRSSRDLVGLIDRHLIVTIPYLSTPGEDRRKRRKLILICAALIVLLASLITAAVIVGISIDFFSFDRSWLDALTRLLH